MRFEKQSHGVSAVPTFPTRRSIGQHDASAAKRPAILAAHRIFHSNDGEAAPRISANFCRRRDLEQLAWTLRLGARVVEAGTSKRPQRCNDDRRYRSDGKKPNHVQRRK